MTGIINGWSVVLIKRDSWWSGYALSNETSKTYATLDDQFHSAAGGAHQGDNFLVYYDDT